MFSLENSKVAFVLFSLICLAGLQACGPKAFTKGEYDDPNKVILLDDKFNENDMQLMSNSLVESLGQYEKFQNRSDKPTVMIGQVRNRTSEHIDVKMLTDKIRTALIKSGKFRFVDKDARAELAEEYQYQSGEYIDQATAVKKGHQKGVQYIINGDLGSNVQQVGRDKVVYYKVTMNLIDATTNTIDWAEEREVRKIYKKRTISE